MESRWHPRFEVDQPATIMTNGANRPRPAVIKNYSMGGLFLETPIDLARHQFLLINIPHNGGSTLLRGMVIHTPGTGVGVEVENRFWPRLLGWKESHCA